jgi:hypothetical protein
MPVELEVKDTGSTSLAKRLGALTQTITIGIHEDAGSYPDGTPVAVVGAAQEFGTPTTPARSWLRGWLDSGGQSVIANTAQQQISKVVDGDAPASVGAELGGASVKGIVDRMDRGISGAGGEPARDLRDTGRLIEAIEFEVTP